MIYTLRETSDFGQTNNPHHKQWSLVKWSSFLDGHRLPEDVYSMSHNYCGCPSPRKPCKHYAIKDAIIEFARLHNVPTWVVGWQDTPFLIQDITTPEELAKLERKYNV